MGVTWSLFVPPSPTITEANIGSLAGKVFIVTGGYSGVGLELSRILYQAGGKVYVAGRSEEKARAAIAKIRDLPPPSGAAGSSPGDLVFFPFDLADLATIKPAVERFKAAESRLDVLFNNAGVSNPPAGSHSAQGDELQLATNCLGPYLLTQLLLPTLEHTAKFSSAEPAAVRVIWTSSITSDLGPPGAEVFSSTNLANLGQRHPQVGYSTSKLGNWFLASDLARTAGGDGEGRGGGGGILSLCVNPGNLQTQLTRHMPAWVPYVFAPLLYHPRFGAYTNLWAGMAPELGLRDGGKFVLPWGRLHPAPREDLLAMMRRGQGQEKGAAEEFVAFCDERTRDFR